MTAGQPQDIPSISSVELLGPRGPMVDAVPEFEVRPGQQRMAQLVEKIIHEGGNGIIEAPSGSGKTLGYLVPIVAHHKRSIISTATHYLQDQLFRRDIPAVQKALGSTLNVAILKGRSNYICPYYLQKNCGADTQLSRSMQLRLEKLWRAFRAGQITGHLPENARSLQPYISCSSNECLGSSCSEFKRCPYFEARKRAARADIVVVNHSLLFSDQMSRLEYLTELIPSVDLIVVDEAHKLAEYAQSIVGESLSSKQLQRYCNDALQILRTVAADQKPAQQFLLQLLQAIETISRSVPSTNSYRREQHVGIIEQLNSGLEQFANWLDKVHDRHYRLKELSLRNKAIRAKISVIKDGDGLCWLQPLAKGFQLRQVPVNLSTRIETFIKSSASSWLFTSATLSIEGKADRFIKTLGLVNTPNYFIEQGFDFSNSARLYTPKLSVDPSHPDYSQQLAEKVGPLIEAVSGRVLFLFSSHAALKRMATLLSETIDCLLLVQGERDNYQLIERFRQSPQAVLLGTGSFWEGLDLSTVSLSCVIQDKLPFVSPADPLVQLRSADMDYHGVESFSHYLLADAVIKMRQGCGRLLRRSTDRGVIMLADPRIHSKDYGNVFLNSLPSMIRSNELQPLMNFIAANVAHPVDALASED